MNPAPLSHPDLSTVIRLGPVVCIDLIIRNSRDEILLGLRNNAPAKGFYFVPGARIWKSERLHQAFLRILKSETNLASDFNQARLKGVYDHIYPENRFDDAGYGTHNVVVAYEITITESGALRADEQHSRLSWWERGALLSSEQVHEFTKCYFKDR